MSPNTLSLMALLSILPISLLARNFNWNKGLYLARSITIPMGVVLTLLMLLRLLGMMGHPNSLYTMLAESMLPSVFSLMQYTILSQLHPKNSTAHTPWQVKLATIMICGVALFYAGLQQFLLSLIDMKTILTLGLGIGFLSHIQNRFPYIQKQTIGTLALQVGGINACYRSIQLIMHWEDPSSVGPHMASIILGLMYGFIFWMASAIHSTSDEDISALHTPISSPMIMGTFFLSYAPIVFFSFSIDLWTMGEQTEKLNIQTDRQHQLLRDLVAQTDTDPTGHITISSDTPAWIFIDDQFISTSPLFKHDLSPGEHVVKIASCPTHNLMDPKDNISWKEYWSQASDGSCREPSETERQELIAQGLAKEIITETSEDYVIVQMEYSEDLNLCCYDSPTKIIQINMTDASQVYAWSFVRQEWIHNSGVQN